MRLRVGVRVRVPVGQSVSVRLISYGGFLYGGFLYGGEGPRVIPGPFVVSGADEIHAVPLQV